MVIEKMLGLFRGAVAGKEIPAPEIRIEFEIGFYLGFEEDAEEAATPELDCIGRSFGISAATTASPSTTSISISRNVNGASTTGLRLIC